MRINSVIFLIESIPDENDLGDTIFLDGEKRKIFAEKKSVRQSEFYQAAATGFKPEIVFEIWTKEFNDELKLEYKGKSYIIFRTFEKGEKTEIVCSSAVNSGDL